MTKKLNDGWNVVADREVYVEDGRITRGLKKDMNGSNVAAYVYRKSSLGGWDKVESVTVKAFETAVEKGKMILS